MKNLKKSISLLLILSLIVTMLVSCTNDAQEPETPVETDEQKEVPETPETTVATTFPENDITGIVQWGAGGGTDSLMRPLASITEDILDVSIVVQNKPGATGAIGAQYVYDLPANGYNLLMGAENPQLYTMLGISELTYANFEPIYLIGDEKVGIIVGKDSKYDSFTELIEDALANPGEISVSSTGAGGMPWSVSSFINAVTGAEFKQIPFDSDATALAAVLGGHADFTAAKVQTALQSYKAGEIKFLSLMSLDEVEALPEVPLVTEDYPDFEQYLPWGPFYGVFVKEGTPKEIIDVLSKAFSEAGEDEAYQKLLKDFNVSYLALTGDEAKEYLTNWQKNTAEAFYKSGAIDKSPAELGFK